jgi:aspartate racemase
MVSTRSKLGILGILGGMGPLASLAFLNTIYRVRSVDREQQAPACLLLSDPSFPDRTEAIESGSAAARELLTGLLSGALAELCAAGADRILIACVTIHHFLPGVAAALRSRVIPLPDLAVERVAACPQSFLLLASSGTRVARIFESHPRWPEIAERMALPDAADQEELHRWLYRLKLNEPVEDCAAWLAELRRKYRVDGLVFGCTELHLLQPHRMGGQRPAYQLPPVVDPLLIAAESLPELLAGTGAASRSSNGSCP